jgi:hypothetical protein
MLPAAISDSAASARLRSLVARSGAGLGSGISVSLG